MKRFFNAAIVALSLTIIFLISVLIFTAGNYKMLVKENETLILKYDSLHILQLQTKSHLLFTLSQMDSVFKRR